MSLIFAVLIFPLIISTVNGRSLYNFTVATVTPQSTLACSTLGVQVLTNVDKKYRSLDSFQHHNFQFPPIRENYYLCVPSKSGNRNWGGLMYRLWYGRPPPNYDVLMDTIEDFSYPENFDRRNAKIWLVARSPYVRLLSIYLEKVRCKRVDCHHDFSAGLEVFRGMGFVSFEKFVSVLVESVTKGATESAVHEYMQDRFPQVFSNSGFSNWSTPESTSLLRRKLRSDVDPSKVSSIERGSALCEFNHHLCIQASGLFKLDDGKVRLLRLEEQGSWFNQFTQCMGIDASHIVGEDWRSFSGQPCFYTPTGDCADAMGIREGVHLITGGVHGKGSADLIGDFYTPRVASLATYLYEYDLTTLGYELWNGTVAFENKLRAL